MSSFGSRLLEDATEYVALVFLGLWERQIRLHLRVRQLDRALRLDLGNHAIEEAHLACERAQLALVAGRELDRREHDLLRDLQTSGATRLELWLMFSGQTIRSVSSQVRTGWRWIEWGVYATVAVATALMVLPVVAIVTENAYRGFPPHWNSLSVFVVGIGVHAWVWNLYLTEPLIKLRKWKGVIDPYRPAKA